ncbi:hypothetical protein A8C32_18730 [Flavivirga aquatica]|uniref:Anti-sigma factor n=1 Tax=Flavivirga aquatica TaxID=1849968 RepID=A0A1E5T3W1_9FLAO|nr:hypothetical protein [Flavivirga aquatica]OEK06068.1 hypothetical protein A8C32_18730 [Flavivirga aquatica]
MDELEKYIVHHRDKFDDRKMDESDKLNLWSHIAGELSEPPIKVIPLWRKSIFRVAASIVILLGCTFSFFMINGQNLENQIVNEELSDIDNHYRLLVNNQIELIKKHSNLSKEDQADFLLLIDDLDEEYQKLKEDLKQGINNKKIVEAIINNYRKKIKLMEDLLERSYPTKNNFEDEAFIL